MVLVIDVLQVLGREGALDCQSLANALGCVASDLHEPLEIGVRRGMIRVGERGWAADPASFIGDYTITQAGEELYRHVLDRFAQMVAGPGGLSIPERFLYASAEDQPDQVRRQLVTLAENAGLQVFSEANERDRALVLANAAIRRWARAALNSRPETYGRALGIDSLDLGSPDALGYAAQLMREEYLVDCDEIQAEVVAAAASAAESASGLGALAVVEGQRPLQQRSFDSVLAREVAEYSAQALSAVSRSGLLQISSEAQQVIGQMTRRQPTPAQQ